MDLEPVFPGTRRRAPIMWAFRLNSSLVHIGTKSNTKRNKSLFENVPVWTCIDYEKSVK
jgi:hypothetical protein